MSASSRQKVNQGSVNCEKEFQLGEILGEGGFGQVREGFYKGKKYAIKIINHKRLLVKIGEGRRDTKIISSTDKALFEALITSYLYSKGCSVVNTHYAFKCDALSAYIVMDKLNGMELRDVISKYRNEYYSKFEDMTRQMLEGLKCCHSHGIIHGDIKPENIYVEDGAQITYIDFGLSCYSREFSSFKEFLSQNISDEILETFNQVEKCRLNFQGTHIYIPPEHLGIVEVKNTTRKNALSSTQIFELGDAYSLGVTLYVMWLGGLPMNNPTNQELFFKKMEKEFKDGKSIYPPENLNFMYGEKMGHVKDIIVGLTQMDYRKRMSINDALKRLSSRKVSMFSRSNMENDILPLVRSDTFKVDTFA